MDEETTQPESAAVEQLEYDPTMDQFEEFIRLLNVAWEYMDAHTNLKSLLRKMKKLGFEIPVNHYQVRDHS